MGYKLCTAEKYSVAKDIARIVGAKEGGGKIGYFYGNGYIVTWAVGHLVGLAEPNEYGFVDKMNVYKEEYREKVLSELPLIPNEFKLVVLEATKKQYDIVKELIHRDDVTEIIDCGDMGAEGHILQWFIREKAGCNKPIRRFCAVSLTDKGITTAMNNLRNIDDFKLIIRGEFCKKKADWVLGMSLSRLLSLKYHVHLPVGRVQTPTLAFVVKRYMEVVRFKSTTYYTLEAKSEKDSKTFSLFWNADIDHIIDDKLKDKEKRVLDKKVVEDKCDEIKTDGLAKILKVKVEQKKEERPKLYDILNLQRDANRMYGYSAQYTLDIAQALYETQKVLSYPRTDSQYITDDLAELMPERMKMIGSIKTYNSAVNNVLNAGLNIDKKICDNSKVTDHHALVVTERIQNFNIDAMIPTDNEKSKGVTPDAMKNILNLVIARMIMSFSQPFVYEQTDIIARMKNGMTFFARGRKPISLGWKSVEETLIKESKVDDSKSDDNEDTSQIFPSLEEGQIIRITDCVIKTKKTQPPKLHTEDTLLSAMMNAGSKLENGAILKGKGIGTQATRGEIIKKLHQEGYIEDVKKGKTVYLQPTMKGLKLIQVLPPDLYNPQLSADWETKIANIASGAETEKQFMDDFEIYIKDKTQQLFNLNTDVSFNDRESYGDCPFCGKPVYRKDRKNGNKIIARDYYCSDWQNCLWRLKTDDIVIVGRTGKQLSDANAKKFIKNKSITLVCKKKDGTGEYKGEFTFFIKEVNNDGTRKKYCNVNCNFVSDKK